MEVTLVDTGENTLIGGRPGRARDYLDNTFCFTYGDGVADVDINALVAHHRARGKASHTHGGATTGPLWGDRA